MSPKGSLCCGHTRMRMECLKKKRCKLGAFWNRSTLEDTQTKEHPEAHKHVSYPGEGQPGLGPDQRVPLQGKKCMPVIKFDCFSFSARAPLFGAIVGLVRC